MMSTIDADIYTAILHNFLHRVMEQVYPHINELLHPLG